MAKKESVQNIGEMVVEVGGQELSLQALVLQYFLDRKFEEGRAKELAAQYVEELSKDV